MSTDASDSGSDAFEDSEEYQKGVNGEEIVEVLVGSWGWWNEAARRYDRDGAPTAQRSKCYIVRPDLRVMKYGEDRCIEVKAHTETTYHRKSSNWQHGIDKRHWMDYKAYQHVTAADVWLFIIDRDWGEILQCRIDDLEIHHEWQGYAYGGFRHMVFFNHALFENARFEVNAGEDGNIESVELSESRLKSSELSDPDLQGRPDPDNQPDVSGFSVGWDGSVDSSRVGSSGSVTGALQSKLGEWSDFFEQGGSP